MRRDTGSLLIIALVTVSAATLLALALGAWMGAQSRALEATRYRRAVREGAYRAAVLALAEHVLPDTNGWDALQEPWAREPWERREAGWVMRVSGTGWREEPGATIGMIDESGKLPVDRAPMPWIQALFQEVAGVPPEAAADLARRLIDWQDADSEAAGATGPEAAAYGTREHPWAAPNRALACLEELARVPGVDPELLQAAMPCLTVVGGGRINLNTAAEPVLRSALRAAAAGDDAAAGRLLERILAYRRAGQVFTAPAAQAIARALGGLPPDEAALLGRAEGYIAVQARVVSGVAEATPASAWAEGRRGGRAWFAWDRTAGRFIRWIEE